MRPALANLACNWNILPLALAVGSAWGQSIPDGVVTPSLAVENSANIGSILSDYLPAAANGNYTLRLNGRDTTSIGFHDSGSSMSSIRYSEATGFEIGGNDGYGCKPVKIPGILSAGYLGVGSVTQDYQPGSPTAMLNGLDWTSLAFHDSNHSIASIRYSGPTGFIIGASEGYGSKNCSFPGSVGIGTLTPGCKLQVDVETGQNGYTPAMRVPTLEFTTLR